MATLPQPVQALIEASNAGDVEAFLNSFTDDGVVDDWGRKFPGRQAINGWSDNEYIGKQMTLDVTSAETAGSQTVVKAQVGGNGFNGPSTFTFEVAGDKVASMTIRE